MTNTRFGAIPIATALPAVLATALLALTGCSAPEPDIEAQREAMTPLVSDLADLIFVDGVPEDEIFDTTVLCDALEGERRRTREQYSELWRVGYGDAIELAPHLYDVEAVFAEHGIEPTITILALEPESYETEWVEYSYDHEFEDGGSVRLRFWLGDGIADFQLSAGTGCATTPGS